LTRFVEAVRRGVFGCGAHSRVHTTKILRISEDMPMIVETVDSVGHLAPFIAELDRMTPGGLVTLEPVEVIVYQHNEESTGRDSLILSGGTVRLFTGELPGGKRRSNKIRRWGPI